MTLPTLTLINNNNTYKLNGNMSTGKLSSASLTTELLHYPIDGKATGYTATVNQLATSMHAGPISEIRFTNDQTRRYYHGSPPPASEEVYQLPPIQELFKNNSASLKIESPSPPFDSYRNFSTSPISSIASSPSPIDEDAEDTDESNSSKVKQQMVVGVRRKGSIASILNSDPELKMMDAEEHKFDYQSFFFYKQELPSEQQRQLEKLNSAKRGRPRLDQSDPILYNNDDHSNHLSLKKQRTTAHHVKNTELNVVDNSVDSITMDRVLPSLPHLRDVQQQGFQNSQQFRQSNSFTVKDSCNKAQHVNTAATTEKAAAVNADNSRSTKGLRHFSKQVYDKVAEKGVTTYNEVANELALEMQNNLNIANHFHDQKNIRRRVYDALNVLMAMNIIAKDKKVIKWLGMPSYLEEEKVGVTSEESERRYLLNKIYEEKLRQKQLADAIDKLRCTIDGKVKKRSKIRSLIDRNYTTSKHLPDQRQKVQLPFFMIVCRTEENCEIDVEATGDARSAVILSPSPKNGHSNNISVYEDTDIVDAVLSRDLAVSNIANSTSIVRNSSSSIYSLLETPTAVTSSN